MSARPTVTCPDETPLLAEHRSTELDMRRTTSSASSSETAAASCRRPSKPEAPVPRQTRRRCLSTAWCVLIATMILITTVVVNTAERPKLRLRQLLQPLQWAMIGSYHPTGFEVVKIPPDVHLKLLELVSAERISHPDVTYGPGEGQSLEDIIIFGNSARIYMSPALQAKLRATFRPLVSSFCACELEEHATIGGGGVRIYRQGASLAAHLDWAHKFVVSVTMHVRTAGNRTPWPISMRAFGGATRLVTHAEGEAVLYEGSRMVHSRPEPLADDFYAAAFVGFVPKAYPAGRGLLTQLYVGLVRSMS